MSDTKTIGGVTVKDADKGLVTAVISTFGVIDLDGDVTAKSTFTDGAAVLISDYGHTSWDGAPAIGKGTLRTTDTEAIAELEFNLEMDRGREVFKSIKFSGPLQEWSYSLHDTKRTTGELDGIPAMFIDTTNVKEVSPVLRGASIGTRTLATKGAGLTFAEHTDAVLAAVTELRLRATDVMALRAEKGKTIGDLTAAQLRGIAAELLALKAVTDAPTPDPEAFAAELARTALVLAAILPGA